MNNCKLHIFLILCLWGILLQLNVSAQTTIQNGHTWIDNNGNDVQAHGAGFLFHEGRWYMIGEDRSDYWNPDVNMYSSTDLVNWRFENKIIKNGVTHPDLGTERFIERPKLLRCPNTGQFVVWCHWEQSNYGASEAAVFYCNTINGDYTYHWSGRPDGIKSRDCNVFQDVDGKAYFVSTTDENQHLTLFELSDDYLSVAKTTRLSEFDWEAREAPAIVNIDGTYFLISSRCTGWDPNQATVSWSNSLESGWSPQVNIGNSIAFDTQPASILTIQGSQQTSYLYVGDRWWDTELPDSKTIMFPISFSGTTCNFSYSHQFDIDFSTGIISETPRPDLIPKTDWSIQYVSSEETTGENGSAVNAIDGDINTIWHTEWYNNSPSHSHEIQVDMGDVYKLSKFLCVPRTDGSYNGTIGNFELYFSIDGQNWAPVKAEWMLYYTEVSFEPVVARYFKLVTMSGFMDNQFAAVAEFELSGSLYEGAVVPVTGVSVLPTSISIAAGQNATLSATVTPVDATNSNLQWSSDDTGVATVNIATGVVTAVAPGTANITATSTDGTNISSSCAVTVSCSPSTILPYVQVNTNEWQNTTSVNTQQGDQVSFGPQPFDGTWSWTGPDDFISTEREPIISNIQASQAGDYIVTYTNTCGAQSTATFTVFVSEPTNLNVYYNNRNADKENKLQIYPNPVVGGIFKIRFINVELDKDATVSVFDLTGRKVYSTPANTDFITVSTDLKTGEYMVMTVNGDQVFTQKIIVKK